MLFVCFDLYFWFSLAFVFGLGGCAFLVIGLCRLIIILCYYEVVVVVWLFGGCVWFGVVSLVC